MTFLIITNLILVFLLIMVGSIVYILLKWLKELKLQINNYDETQIFIQIRREDAKRAGIGSQATIFSSINYMEATFDIDIPVYLIEKNNNGLLYRFELDVDKLPNRFPYNQANFRLIMQLNLDIWYKLDSETITWMPFESKDVFLTEAELKELKYLVEFSNTLPDKKKDIVYKLLKISRNEYNR